MKARRIADVLHHRIAVSAGEPPRNNYFSDLAPGFACALHLTIQDCRADGLNIGLFEGARSQDRQLWLWQQGRERPGEIVTNVKNARTGWHYFKLAGDVALRVGSGWSWNLKQAEWDRIEAHARRYGLASPISWDNPHLQPSNLKVTPSALASKLWAQSPETLWDYVGWHAPRFLDSLEAL